MKILFLQLGRIGDMILATSAFSAIKEKYPKAEIHVLAGRHNYQIAKIHKYVSKVFVYRKKPIDIIKLFLSLKKEKYDFFISTKDHASSETRLFAKLAKADYKIGFNCKGKPDIFDYSVPSELENREKHFVDQTVQALKPLGIHCDKLVKPMLFEASESEKFADDFVEKELGARFALINISAHSETRLWQKDKWVELANYLNEKGCKVLINASPEHRETAKEIIAQTPSAYLFPSRSIIDVISITARAWLVVTPDTSIVHIAGAFNTPILALYGSNPIPLTKFKPLSDICVLLTPQAGDYISEIDIEEAKSGIDRIFEAL